MWVYSVEVDADGIGWLRARESVGRICDNSEPCKPARLLGGRVNSRQSVGAAKSFDSVTVLLPVDG